MSLCAAKRRLVGPMVRVITPCEREELLFFVELGLLVSGCLSFTEGLIGKGCRTFHLGVCQGCVCCDGDVVMR